MQSVLSSETVTLQKKSFLSSDIFKLVPIVLFGLAFWYFFQPAEISNTGWNLFVVFVCTIAAIILKPLPMGALSLIAISLLALTKTLSLPTMLNGFASDVIWLIVMACFLARGFIKTGLGRRIAYAFVSLFGGSPLGLSYGILLSAFTMSPLIPSTTARTGGIFLPVLKSLINVMEDETHDKSKKSKIAQFLTLIVFHSSVVTSAMFVTSNAGNPMIVKFAESLGISLTWGLWAKAAIVPGIITLLILPPLFYFLIPCKVDNPEKIRDHAKAELHSMGKVSNQEKILVVIFSLLLGLWAFGNSIGVNPTEAAFLGVGLLLLFKVLSWKELLSEEIAWDTFFWMATLIMLATELQTHGVMSYFTQSILTYIPSSSWMLSIGILSVIYFYSHYFFASTTAHISSMYTPLLTVAITLGTPAPLAGLALAFISNLFGGLTHYASGPAPILYAQGYVDVKTWWKIGIITSFVYLFIWVGLGSLWWKWLGLF
jgi:divalent anion:Na+ symporter, DASS family